jgi:hypothetical protein
MRALSYTIAAVAVPTLIRLTVDGIVSGCELTIYLPFVLICAIFMGWKHAAAATLSSAVVAELLLMGPHHNFIMGPCDGYSVGVLFLGSAVLIGVVHAFRSVIAGCFEPLSSSHYSNGGIVFSLHEGKAWASWYGQKWPVQLGPESEVAEMMEDFLAQVELGKRLAQRVH